MNTLAEISKELRSSLKASGLNQKALRESVGVSRQTMSNVLKGTEDFRLTTLLAVADRLGLAVMLIPKAAAHGLRGSVPEAIVETRVERVRKSLGTDRMQEGKS